jgi:hypothetical protein
MDTQRPHRARYSAFGAALLLSVLAVTAGAQDRTKASSDSVTEYGFDDELVAGVDRESSGEVLQVRKMKRGESLVRARTSFLDRLLKSVESFR